MLNAHLRRLLELPLIDFNLPWPSILFPYSTLILDMVNWTESITTVQSRTNRHEWLIKLIQASQEQQEPKETTRRQLHRLSRCHSSRFYYQPARKPVLLRHYTTSGEQQLMTHRLFSIDEEREQTFAALRKGKRERRHQFANRRRRGLLKRRFTTSYNDRW